MSESQSREYEINKMYTIKVSDLTPNPEQPRKYFNDDEIKALATDINANGLLQNITFTCREDKLIIISGERRVRAHNQLGKEVIEGKYVEGDLMTLALMENILRSDLTAIEFAESVAALQKQKNCSNDDIARIIGKKKSTTSEILKIASLPEAIRDDARTKPYMTRECLLKVARRKDADVQKKMYDKLLRQLQTQQRGKSEHGDADGSSERVADHAAATEAVGKRPPHREHNKLHDGKSEHSEEQPIELQVVIEAQTQGQTLRHSCTVHCRDEAEGDGRQYVDFLGLFQNVCRYPL